MMAEYDFVIVGGGAAGCALAARLAAGLPHHQVLLLDAGGKNADASKQAFGERHWTLVEPGYNWGYKSVAQSNLGGREIDYSRGKGLGGCTAVNFCVYTRGPTAAYNYWAELVGDDSWSWESAQRRFKKIESFRTPALEYQGFVAIDDTAHGKEGPIAVGYPDAWDPSFGEFMNNAYHYYPRNLDHNSGDPIGISVCQLSAKDRKRVTASGAYLSAPPSNLEVLTETTVTKVILEDKRAIGVVADGKQIFAKREVILSAGALDSPKLLLLSGIGPAKDLRQLGISVSQDLPGIGKNLQDRLFLDIVTVQKPESHHRTLSIDTPAALEQARKQWMEDASGSLSAYYLPQMIGYLRNDKTLTSHEFQDVEITMQRLLQTETKPTYEIFSQCPDPTVKAPEKYLSTAVAFDGNHGSGELKLRSKDANDHPIIDPKFMTHPFDKRVAIDAVRETLAFLKTPLMSEGSIRLAAGPAEQSDADILL